MYYGNLTTAWSSCFGLFLNYISIFIIKVFIKKKKTKLQTYLLNHFLYFFFLISFISRYGYVFSNCIHIIKQFLKIL